MRARSRVRARVRMRVRVRLAARLAVMVRARPAGEEGGLHEDAGGQRARRVHRARAALLLVHVKVRVEAAAVARRRELLGQVPERRDHLRGAVRAGIRVRVRVRGRARVKG